MSRPKPTILRLHQLEVGQQGDCFVLLQERSKGLTRDGKPFYTCRFRDNRRTVSSVIWADSDWFKECAELWAPGMFFKIRGTYGEHERYGPQIELHIIRPIQDSDRADGFAEGDFLERSRFESAPMFAELLELVERIIQDTGLKQLLRQLLEQHREMLLILPASPRHFFPFRGGWLEHTLNVTKNCLWLAERYGQHYHEARPPLNRDLIVAGAILHDIGRVQELTMPVDPTAPWEISIAGRLFGHVQLTRDLVRDAARTIVDLSEELRQLLDHLLLSYLAIPEWGSPRLPMIPEALILHHADDLDAKLEMYLRCLEKDTSEGPFTERDPQLGKPLLKNRTV